MSPEFSYLGTKIADGVHEVNDNFVFVCSCFWCGRNEVCLNVKNKPIERDSERNNSIVNSLERQEGMGSGAEEERLPKEKKRDTLSILAGLNVEGIGADAAGLVLLVAESGEDE